MEIPPAERSEQLWLALAGKLEEEQVLEHQRLMDAFLATGNQPSSDVSGERLFEYFEYTGRCGRPVARHSRIACPDCLGTQRNPIDPIVQFGEPAVAPLITGARQGHFFEQLGVLQAIEILLKRRPDVVTSQSRQQIRDLARDLLKPRVVPWPTITWPAVSRLPLATGDPDLRQQVQMLADLPSEWSNTTAITDANQSRCL